MFLLRWLAYLVIFGVMVFFTIALATVSLVLLIFLPFAILMI